MTLMLLVGHMHNERSDADGSAGGWATGQIPIATELHYNIRNPEGGFIGQRRRRGAEVRRGRSKAWSAHQKTELQHLAGNYTDSLQVSEFKMVVQQLLRIVKTTDFFSRCGLIWTAFEILKFGNFNITEIK
jgi:hypothetical protein